VKPEVFPSVSERINLDTLTPAIMRVPNESLGGENQPGTSFSSSRIQCCGIVLVFADASRLLRDQV